MTRLISAFIRTFALLALFSPLAACMGSSGQYDTGPRDRWTGVVAVQESAEVWRLYDQTAGDLTRFVQLLEAGLDNGTVQPAVGSFTFMPYAGGRPTGDDHTVRLTARNNGTWYQDAPAEYFADGRGMCVRGPWDVIATQRLYPSNGGPNTNCIDFSGMLSSSNPTFADSNNNAATIVMVMPAG